MDTPVINRYVLDYALLRSFYYRRFWLRRGILMIVFAVMPAVLSFFAEGSPIVTTFLLTSTILMLVLVFSSWLQCRNNTEGAAARLAEPCNGRAPTMEITLTADELSSHTVETGNTTVLPISKLQTVLVTRDLLVFVSKANSVIFMKKNAFRQGSTEDVLSLLAMRGIPLKSL